MTVQRYAVAKDGLINPKTEAESAAEAMARGLLVFFDTRTTGWPEGMVDDVWKQWLWRLSQEEPDTVLKVVELA